MKKSDKRIVRPEQMNERDRQIMSEAIDAVLDKMYASRPSNIPEDKIIVINGVQYHKDYYKGELKR